MFWSTLQACDPDVLPWGSGCLKRKTESVQDAILFVRELGAGMQMGSLKDKTENQKWSGCNSICQPPELKTGDVQKSGRTILVAEQSWLELFWAAICRDLCCL